MRKHVRFIARILPCLAMLMLPIAGAVQALEPGEMFDDPVKEQRARDIGRSLRCLVCQNQSIFDSNASLAKDLRVLVRERMKAGDSDEEVIEFVASQYGSYVLLEPPLNSYTYALWIAPVIFILLGAALAIQFRRRNKVSRHNELSGAAREAAQRILRGGN